MVVMKFGGTSVQNAAMMDRAIGLCLAQMEKAPIMVSSAMSKVTDSLLAAIAAAVEGDEKTAFSALEGIFERHRATAREFLGGVNLATALETLETMFKQLASLAKGLVLLKECSVRTSDAFVAFGELMSTVLLYHRSIERGAEAEWLDARGFVRTDDHFGSAAPDMAETRRLVAEKLRPRAGRLLITQGFIGSTAQGVTTTLGRGGSDYSATIIGSCLGVDEVQIWTDVDGIMTMDPRMIKDARSIAEISYSEAAELAYFGAKVVHPSTIQPAVDQRIPVWVKNTMGDCSKGTLITHDAPGMGLRAIAAKKAITLINVVSSRMLNAYGFLSTMFEVFERFQTPVDLIATSEVSVSMSVESTRNLDAIVKALERFASVELRHNRSIICLVGKDIHRDPDFFVRVFKAIKPIEVQLVSLGASKINLSLVVSQDDADRAVRLLHDEFFV